MSISVSEESVGITDYTSSLPGFTGILKHRFRDFQVNEIDQHGAVVRLEGFALPPTLEPKVEAREILTGSKLLDQARALADDFEAVAGSGNAAVLYCLLRDIAARSMEASRISSEGQAAGGGDVPVETLLDAPSEISGLEALVFTDARGEGSSCTPLMESVSLPLSSEALATVQLQELPGGGVAALLEPMADKGVRTAVHNFFKQHLPQLVTEAKATVTGETKEVRIQIVWRPASKRQLKNGQGQKRPRDGERGWVGGRDNYTQFVLYKENMDTQMAIGLIASNLHLGQQVFGFAGTKDKRGVTSQLMTAYRVEPSRLAGLNHKLRGIRLGNFSFSQHQLQLGLLTGNEFRLLMRAVVPENGSGEDKILEACRKVSEVGFINYFGLQRFGAGGTPTHRVGAALLRGEFSAAVRMILGGKPGEKPDIAAARAAFLKDGDAKASLRLMPRWATAERAILEVLSKKGNGAVGEALMAVPRTLRMMYLHAYQSYLWNLAASHRVRTFGANCVVEGDLVMLVDEEKPVVGKEGIVQGAEDLLVPISDPLLDGEEAVAAEVQSGGVMDPTAELSLNVASTSTASLTSRQRLARVHVVTRAEVEAGRWSMQDVVLPVPGKSTRYPAHSTRLVYAAAAARDGIALPGLVLESDAVSMDQLLPSLPARGREALLQLGNDSALLAASSAASGDLLGSHNFQETSRRDTMLEATPCQEGVGSEDGQVTAPQSSPGPSTLTGNDPAADDQLSAKDKLADDAVHKTIAAEFGFSSLTGDYRRVVLRPKGFEWGLKRYSDPNDDSLIQTDLEKLQSDGQPRPDKCNAMSRDGKKIRTNEYDSSRVNSSPAAAGDQGSEGHEGPVKEDSEPAGLAPHAEGKGPMLALWLKFQLPSSCYATMLIRELTKQSTTKDFQAALSAAKHT